MLLVVSAFGLWHIKGSTPRTTPAAVPGLPNANAPTNIGSVITTRTSPVAVNVIQCGPNSDVTAPTSSVVHPGTTRTAPMVVNITPCDPHTGVTASTK